MKKCRLKIFCKKTLIPLLVFASTVSDGQYCTPTSTYGCAPYGDEIDDFTLSGVNGTAITDLNSGCSTGSYANKTAMPPVDLAPGGSYTSHMSTDYYISATNGDFCNIWIDFNDNGTFEQTEIVAAYGQMISLSGSDVTLTIPSTAQLGIHRMRVSMYWVNKSTVTPSQVNACNTGTFIYTYGETQDYNVNIVTLPLPIVLKSITAENIGNTNNINWSASMETKGDYFVLERSRDGKQFITLASITSQEGVPNYVYEDKTPFSGENFYRLKIMGANGQYFYSNIINAKVSASTGFSVVEVYPNPTSNYILLKAPGSNKGKVRITDISGITVYQTAMTGAEMKIDMRKFANGCYLLHYDNGAINKVIKVNKQ